MKGIRGNFLRKLKLIQTKTTLKQGLVLHLNPQDVLCIQKCPIPPIYDEYKENNNLAELEIDKHFEEEEIILNDKDKATTIIESKETEQTVLLSPNLSDTKMEEVLNSTPPQVTCIKELEYPSLNDFEEKCPPGGSQSIILYTTSLRGIRKTFQDCNTIRFLLRSFKIMYHERDVSLHLEYREELWKILGGKVIPPKLFIKGRYIGGADEVVGLHEIGWLGKFLEGTPTDSTDCPCIGCANMRFTICSNCCGSCKVFTSNDEYFHRCTECNENGLVKCPICC
ncbi:Thioredoxin-like superfamily [Sesbania bispinosa]|nr:Thioredoxin-like superfamily [Sesbania bispinosa]